MPTKHFLLVLLAFITDILCCQKCVKFESEQHRIIDIDNGLVRGFKADDGEYFSYLGIPYAAPPTGKNRFKAPLPAEPWKGILEANKTIQCLQENVGQEDCLVLNVFTPLMISQNPSPVLVYIHGGAFLINSGNTRGISPLTDRDIIVVTINYRLNAFGFLCLGTDNAPGNAGLKDQVAALQWIKENIASFNGDPKLITLYGTSAGSASIELLILARLGRELFKRAIMESGSALNVWAINFDPITTAYEVATLIDYKGEKDADSLTEFYLNTPAYLIADAIPGYTNSLLDGTFGFAPCIENDLHDSKPLLLEDPAETIKVQDFEKVPILAIFSTFEGINLIKDSVRSLDKLNGTNLDFSQFLPADIEADDEEVKKEIGEQIKQFYLGSRTESASLSLVNFFGDNLILYAFLNSIEQQMVQNIVYLMEFAYAGKLGFQDPDYNFDKAVHGDVSKYVFLNEPWTTIAEEDKVIIQRVVNLISDFVKIGVPASTIEWPRATPSNMSYVVLDKNGFSLHHSPYKERRAFWNGIYEKYRKTLNPLKPKRNAPEEFEYHRKNGANSIWAS